MCVVVWWFPDCASENGSPKTNHDIGMKETTPTMVSVELICTVCHAGERFVRWMQHELVLVCQWLSCFKFADLFLLTYPLVLSLRKE